MLDYHLLGPIEVSGDGEVLHLGGQKQRVLLAVLLLSANEPVPRDVLIDRLWGDSPPAGAHHTLEVYISRLRKALEPAAGSDVILSSPGAYLLRAATESIDTKRFEWLARQGRRALADGAPDQAVADLREALTLWRGAALADVSHEPFVRPEIVRLNELRIGVIEDRIEADLALGRHADVISELGALVAAHPLRERLYQLQMVALYRCGRQSEALAAYQAARRVLVGELGIEPSPATKRLERAILEQDASLDLTPQPPSATTPADHGARRRPATAWAWRRRVQIAIGASLTLALALLVVATGPRRAGVSAAADTVAVINARSAAVTKVVAGVGSPGGIAHGAGATWVTDTADSMLLRIDSAGQVVDRIPVGRGPAGVAVGAGEVWVANEFDSNVSEVNPTTGTVVATIGVGSGPQGVAYGYGSVWVVNVTSRTLSRIDPRTGRIASTVPLGSDPAGIAAGAGGIWLASPQTGRLLLVDPRRDAVTAAFAAGVAPDDVTIGAGSVWVSDAGGTVARLNPRTGAVHEIKVGGTPSAVVYANRATWVTNGLGSVLRIDPQTSIVRSIHVGNVPSALAGAGGDVLVTVLPSLASHRGGTLTMDAQFMSKGAFASPDLAVAWNSWYWQMLIMTNDGLVGYQRVGGPAGEAIVPDLATALPTISDNGRTYVFRVRRGIRYSNGDVVRPADFRRAIERDFVINHGSGAASFFYSGIVGAAACERQPNHCDLRQGIVTNAAADTVTFHLTAPDPDFLDKLALPFADAIPPGTPFRLVGPARIPATGPYTTRSLVPGRAWILVRNPRFRQWSKQAQPGGYPDRIVLRLGVGGQTAVDAVENGQADVLLTGPPASRINELATRYANLAHSYPLGATDSLFLNTRVRPFNVLAARQAVNYAIDRNTIVRLLGGPLTAQPTCQVIPPTMPGYQPYCPYTANPGPSAAWQAPDLARAQQLVRASHTAGAKVTVVTSAISPAPATAEGRYLVSLLSKLGYRASLRVIADPHDYWPVVGNSRDRVQVGLFGWLQDFPAPSDFFVPLFTCHSFMPDNPSNLNDSAFCNRQIDTQISKALATQSRSPNAANMLWASVDRQVVNQAPWVPLCNPRALVVLSARVGNYQFHPFWQLLIDQLWVR